MKAEICNFLREQAVRFNLRADYLVKKDVYRLTKNGKMVMAFYTDTWYSIPPRMRRNHILPMIKLGLTHNVGESSTQEQMYSAAGGKRIV